MTTAGSPGRLDIGAALSDSFVVLQRRGAHFLVASVLLVALPQFLSVWVRYMNQNSAILSVALGLAVFVLSLALQGGLFYATVQELSGEATEVGDMFGVGFRACLPLVVLTLLVGIPAELGLFLLIVPGVLLFLRWSLAGPAMVVEKLGILGAMRRSAELTKGRRWPLFLAYLILALVIVVIEAVFFELAGGMSGIMALGSARVLTPHALFLTGIVGPALGSIVSVGFGVFGGALFHRLRDGRDGARATVLAEVFA